MRLDRRGTIIAVFVPFMRHRCCFGCFSIHTGSQLVAVAECIALTLCSIEMVKVVLDDGQLFYTTELAGHGPLLAAIYCAFALSWIVCIALMVVGVHIYEFVLLIPHVLMQCVTCGTLGALLALLHLRMQPTHQPPAMRIDRPVGIVLTIQLAVPLTLQLWLGFSTKTKELQVDVHRHRLPALHPAATTRVS